MASDKDHQSRPPGFGIVLTAVLLTVLAMLVVAELISSEALIYRYRRSGVLTDGEFSSFVLLKKAAFRFGLTGLGLTGPDDLLDMETIPSPALKDDPIFGWAAIPGKFTIIYKRRGQDRRWESFPVKVTMNSDQSRWTGLAYDPQEPTIYIFGDSIVLGSGVNDEQTFAYHLQMAKTQYNIRLFALGGYGLVQSYLRMQQLKSEINERDIVIIGYADFYDVRNVAAPSRLRDVEAWYKKRDMQPDLNQRKIPKAEIGEDNRLSIRLVDQDCRVVRNYCDSDDPSPSEMGAISLRLIQEIAASTKARTYLLHFDGVKGNPVVQNSGLEVISALQEDFGYFIRDDIAGFDPHPGPYWHYAIAQKLISRIR